MLGEYKKMVENWTWFQVEYLWVYLKSYPIWNMLTSFHWIENQPLETLFFYLKK
jgi:hypothetical protein